ncbi:MAG: hypothetical protein COU90_04490 [Candidatus Ryanbacteria bacterium CG10_big_fil_rev_8_21_14_0_10_43_42]|uniref:Sortilin N-terminal domain-containing protein n=1 Tax=Candidatus Ryanbacteria bacterium CG10_big_fil_rev_8_21_14_0_10_43_42 TaxID=1974864 RepID=A0A2M8KW19_9BACT|nr:MAG: hypothetical protein COU90_04490 [Candidatus Ryanbacteria bacterium CG10_big_fil_rev_8_21_14_0_10_43_42]
MNQRIKTIILISIAIVSAIIVFLAAFLFFSRNSEEEIIKEPIAHDPDSTVFLSENGGMEWRGVEDIRFSVEKFMFTSDGRVLYTGTNGDGFWQSENGGRAFSLVEDKNTIVDAHSSIFDIALPASRPPEAYVAVFTDDKGRIVTLQDEGFTEIYFSPLNRTAVSALALDPADDSRLFFISDVGFFESRDAGSTWRVVHRFTRPVEYLLAHPRRTGVFWAITSRGELFHSTDYGVTWENINSRFRQFRGANSIKNIFIDKTDRLYMISEEGLFTSVDAGVTWEEIPLIVPPDSLPITAFAVDPNDVRRIYVAAEAQLYTSTDGGDSWQGRDFGGRRTIKAIAIDPRDSNRILIGFDR